MDETVIGIGNCRQMTQALDLAHAECSRNHGEPRELMLKARGVELKATRLDLDEPFDTAFLRLSSARAPNDLKKTTSQLSVRCSTHDEDGWLELKLQADKGDPFGDLRRALDQISETMSLPDVWRITGDHFRRDAINPTVLFAEMLHLQASDVHLYPGAEPVFRVDNRIGTADEFRDLPGMPNAGRSDPATVAATVKQNAPPGSGESELADLSEYTIQPEASDSLLLPLDAEVVDEEPGDQQPAGQTSLFPESARKEDILQEDALVEIANDALILDDDPAASAAGLPGERSSNAADGKPSGSVLSATQILNFVEEIAPRAAWESLAQDNQCSFRYHQLGMGCARVSAFRKSGVPHCTLRFLPESIPTFEALRIPANTMRQIAQLQYGLVLVTGMTGSGKSTTVASLVDWLNEHQSMHILTIEEPIEYVHRNKRSIVSQRQVGVDVSTFQQGVYGALRHDPDVIFIGEMRDADTIRSAISAAATGHLVISTMHSNTTGDVVNQIVSFFDPVERDLVRLQLRDSLQCVMCQRLISKPEGGRVATLEFMFNDTENITEAIHIGDSDALRVAMQQRVSKSSIFEDHLLTLVKDGLMEIEYAARFAPNPHVLEQMNLGTYSIPPLNG